MDGDPVSTDGPAAETIFSATLELEVEERSAYLARTCGDNESLRNRVEALLRAHEGAPRFLPESPAAASFDSLPANRIIGDYELLEEIARGGMGVVYRARQRSLDRTVAVKMILAGQFASREQALRFRAEAEAAARLQHPNIVRIHETGEQDGRPYFSMDYVEGGTLGELVREKPLPARRAAAFVKTIAEAIHCAHEQGVLHRDLKPSNVLIDSNNQPRVTDFGLAKRMQKESFLTVTGDVIGSPNFMPPEQAGAKRVRAGRYNDVYSLGAILFYLVTGRPPFVAENVAETLHQVLNTEVMSPRLLNPSVPQDIATICLKCLEKEPARRYQTAQQLADELGRFLKDEPVRTRPVGRSERAWRWCRRNRALAGTVAAIAALLVIGGIGSVIAAFRIDRERQRAEAAHQNEAQQRRQAEANAKKAQAEATRSRQIAHYLKNMLEDIAPSLAKGCTIKYVREVLTRVDERVGNDLKEQPDLEAVVRTTLAEVQSDIGQHAGAELNLRKVLAMRRQLYGNQHSEVAASLLKLVDLLRTQDKQTEAESLAKEAVAIIEHLVQDNPEREEYRQELGHSQWSLGYVLAETGRREAALETITQALQTFETAANDFPDNAYFRQEQAFSHRTLGDLMNELERVGETERHYHAALEIYAALTASVPTNVFYHAEEAWTTWVFATKLERAGKLDTAAATYRGAVTLYEKAITKFPARAELKSRRDSVRRALASLLSSEGRQNEIGIPPAAQPQEPGGRRPLTQPEIDAVRNSKANRILPLVVMLDIPLADAIMNLARQANLKVTMDPRVTNAVPGPDGKTVPQPTVSISWRNLTARKALMAVLTNYNLVLVDDPATRTARITVKDAGTTDPSVLGRVQIPVANADLSGPTNEARMIETKDLRSQPPQVTQLQAQSAAAPSATLRVGDPAPKLQVAGWVQGEPVKEFEPDKAYLVEFWATWCGPCRVAISHLNKLHAQLKDKGLIVIGQDVWEQDAEAVRPFIEKMGDNMTYRVALDTEDGKMAKTWMEAAERNSIPTAFVVDKRGTIAWIGHTMKLSESLLNQVLAGTFDTEKATADYSQQHKNEEQRRVLWDEFNLRREKKEWDRAETALAEIENLLPDEERDELSMTRFGLLLDRKAYKAAYQLAARLSDEHQDDAMKQNGIAWTIATKEGIAERDLGLAEKIARRANAVAQGNFEKAEILDTLARVLFLKGQKAPAMELQQRAVELAEGDRKRQFQGNLDDYKAGKLPNEAKISRLRQQVNYGIHEKEWGKAESALAELETLLSTEEHGDLGMARFRLLLGRKDYKKAYELATQLSDAHRDEAMFQNQLAWEIAATEDLEERDLDLAEKVARRANDATKGENAEILDTLARVLYLKGQKEPAIDLQQKAVALAKGRRKVQFQKTLDSYQKGAAPKLY